MIKKNNKNKVGTFPICHAHVMRMRIALTNQNEIKTKYLTSKKFVDGRGR